MDGETYSDSAWLAGWRMAVRQAVFSFWRAAVRPRWSLDRAALILVYHTIPSRVGFERQLAILEELRQRRQLQVVAPSDVAAQVRRLAGARRALALTFDDCTVDQYEVAVPALRRWGLPAAFYAPVNCLGKTTTWAKEMPQEFPVPVMDAGRLCDLRRWGFEVGSHGLTHRRFSELSRAEQREELTQSRARLTELLGVPPAGFCFPYGDVPAGTPALAAAAGYDYALGVDRRVTDATDDPYRLPRLAVLGDPAPAEFRAYLEGSIVAFWSRRSQFSRVVRSARARLHAIATHHDGVATPAARGSTDGSHSGA